MSITVLPLDADDPAVWAPGRSLVGRYTGFLRDEEGEVVEGRGRAWIGTSGYMYPHWRGSVYPRGLPVRRWFAHYAQRFDTVEIDNTFYRLPTAEVFEAWREQAPPGFRYSLKLSRYATHFKRLRDPQDALARFLSAARTLGDHLGPVLVQLPPHWRADPGRLDAFLATAPGDVRWAVEFRDPSWLCEEVYAVLRARGAALCLHDLIFRHPRRVTAPWVYLRFHGEHYRGSYSRQFLVAQARRIRGWLAQGLDVYAYFNNDEAGYAVANARDLKRFLGERSSRCEPGPRGSPPR